MGVVKPLRGLREQAVAQVPDHLRDYLTERVLTGGWYPEKDYCELLLLLGRLVAPTVQGSVWRFLGATGADRDFGGIYSALVRQGDPAWTVRQMPAGWSLIRDNGRLTVAELEEGRAELTLRAYPFIGPEIAEVDAAYFEGALRAAGVEGARGTVRSLEPDGARFVLRWD